MRWIFLAIAVGGLFVSHSNFLMWGHATGFDMSRFASDAAATPLGRLAWAEVVISGIVFVMFVQKDAKEHGLPVWPGALGTLLLGISFGLPLYLFLREGARHRDKQADKGSN